MIICGIDFETTGLSATEDRIIECGAVLWEWETGTPLQLMSEFVHPERPIPEEITKITGITDEVVDNWAISEREALTDLDCMLARADYAMAHNAIFDKAFFDETRRRMGWDEGETAWLDTKIDIVYPERITTRNLRHLASEHSFLNPFSHRAVFDVLTMLTVASNYDIDAIIARSKEPTVYVQALTSFEEKELAKARGYYWCAPKKIWWKAAKQSDHEAEKLECGFRTQLLTGAPE